MNLKSLKFQNKSTLLFIEEKNFTFFQGIIGHVIFQLIFLISLFITMSAVEAAPIITNTATANFTINGNNLNLSDSVQFTKDTVVVPTDTIELTKAANVSTELVGNNIVYTLVVKNPNPRPLTNVIIQDELPTGLVYQQNSAKLNNGTISSSEISYSGNTLSINLGTLPAETSFNVTYTINISESTPEGNAINRAVVSSDTATSPQAQTNVVISKPIIVLPLVLEKSVNAEDVKVGDTIRFTLSVENANAFDVTDAVIVDLLPEGLSYINGSAKFNDASVNANVSNNITFDIGNVPASSTSELIYDVKVDTVINNTRILVNTANVQADDPKANSNTATASVTVVDDTLEISKTTTATNVTVGDILDYSITLINPLQRELTNLSIKDNLPLGFSYVIDSARLNNLEIQSADISINANTIDFKIGTLAQSETMILSYKVKVNENSKPGDNVNTAQAVSDYSSSLATTATVKVRTPSIINFLKINNSGVSSIIQPTSYNTNQNGGKNFEKINNIPLLDGSTITLPTPQPIVAASQYTKGEPVVIEVIDLDQNLDPEILETIEVTINVPGTNDTEILLLTETSPNSGVFRGIVLTTTNRTSIQDGVLTIADGVKINVNYRDNEDNTDTSATAALVVPDTKLQLEKSADKDFSAVGELIRYTLEFRNTTGFNLNNLTVHDLLPVGFRYIPNTAELNDNRLNNNVTFNGRTLTFKLNNMPAGSTWKIEYVTKITAGVQIGDAVNTAYLSSDTLRSNDAQAIVRIKDDLMRSKNILTGRVYIGCRTKSDKHQIAPKTLGEARIFMETGRSVLTDREGFWHMEGVYPGAHVLQLDTESIPGYEAILCDDNTRRAKEARSHFVDLQPGSIWHVDFHVKPIEGYSKIVKSKTPKRENTDPTKLFNKNT